MHSVDSSECFHGDGIQVPSRCCQPQVALLLLAAVQECNRVEVGPKEVMWGEKGAFREGENNSDRPADASTSTQG